METEYKEFLLLIWADVISLGFVVFYIIKIFMCLKLLKIGEITTGTITKFIGKFHEPNVSYRAKGNDCNIILSLKNPKWKKGKQLTVLYDPKHPQKACVKRWSFVESIVCFTISLITFILLMVVIIHNVKF